MGRGFFFGRGGYGFVRIGAADGERAKKRKEKERRRKENTGYWELGVGSWELGVESTIFVGLFREGFFLRGGGGGASRCWGLNSWVSGQIFVWVCINWGWGEGGLN